MSKLNKEAALSALPTDEELDEQFEGLKVVFPKTDGKLIEGRLVEWEDNQHFRVVGIDNNKLVSFVLDADSLYKIPENKSLKGAVEFCRTHASELKEERSQISQMLSAIQDEPEDNRAA